MKVSAVIAQGLVSEGVDTVFALMGDGNMWWLAELARYPGIKIFYARHENSAVAMADGYGRATGRVAVCAVTQGPGLTLATNSLVTAQRHGTPLLLLAGDESSHPAHSQYLEQRQYLASLGVPSHLLRSADTAAEDLAFAFALARQGTVVLNAPVAIQDADYRWDATYQPRSWIAQQRIRPEPDAIRSAADLLERSARPVILAGRGAVSSGAHEAILRLRDVIGAKLATTLQAKGFFDAHPDDLGMGGLFASAGAHEVFQEADCVIAVGASLHEATTEAGLLFPDATVIQIDRRPFAPVEWVRTPDRYVQGDARAVVEQLVAELDGRGHRVSEVRGSRETGDSPTSGPAEAQLADGLHPQTLMRMVDEAFGADARLVIDVGHFWSFPIRYLHGRDPMRYAITYDFGAMGQALPTAIGVALAGGSDPVVALVGDGALAMCLQELDTAVRYAAPLAVVVVNDGALGAEYHKLRSRGYDPMPAAVPPPPFVEVATAFGLRAAKARTVSELDAALKDAAAGLRKGPWLIDVRISRSVLAEDYRSLFPEE